MNRDLIRLALLDSRGGFGRPVGIICGIAVGVALLLALLGAANALDERDARSAWLNIRSDVVSGEETTPPLEPNEALIGVLYDFYGDQTIERREIAVAAESILTFPWGTAPPEPGSYYASPALFRLIESVPADQLEQRYGQFAGEIPAAGLASPDSLVVIVGVTEDQMRTSGLATRISDLTGYRETDNPVYRPILIVGGIAMFVPVLLFVGIVTQLGAAQRVERFSTFRLIGAGPGIVVRLTALEMAVLGLIGALFGVLIWLLARPIAARFRIDEGRLHAEDLALPPVTVLAVAIGSVVAATAVAAWQIGRVGIGPLGVTRQQTERPPSAIRVIPLLAGIATMAIATFTWNDISNPTLLEVLMIVGFTLTAFGIIVVGPWLTSIFSRLAMRLSGSATTVIAAGRISRHPAATFRSVSGLVMAVFVASVFAGGASSVVEGGDPEEGPGVLPLSTLAGTLQFETETLQPEAIEALTVSLQTIEGVTVTSIAWARPGDFGLAAIPLADAQALGVAGDITAPYVEFEWTRAIFESEPIENYTPRPVSSLDGRVSVALLVGTDGRQEMVERARTMLLTSPLIHRHVPTRADLADKDTRMFVNSMATLAYIGIAITILIAGISLSVSTAAAILERKRAFGLLRLIGMPAGTLRSIVVIEAVVPLLAVVAISIGFGFFIAWLIVEGLSIDRSLHWPDERYLVTIVASTLLAAAAVGATFGLIRANTGLSQTRFE